MRKLWVLIVASTLAIGVVVTTLTVDIFSETNRNATYGSRVPAAQKHGQAISKNEFLQRACRLPPKWVRLIHRGWAPSPRRDFDMVVVPNPPNYAGTFQDATHSGPYAFLQEVPLVFYGRGFVNAVGGISPDREVTLADVASTYAAMMHFDEWPDRIGSPIQEVINDNPGRPAVIVTVVIDGGGWNVLEHWADTWPNLAELMEQGASIENAIVGTSPSITPSVHTTLSTGTYPRFHGVTGITVRSDKGKLTGAFSNSSGSKGAAATVPDNTVKRSTIADEWDISVGNAAKIGMLIAGNYPTGMMGIGAAQEGGDHDIVGITEGRNWATNASYFSLPAYVNDASPDDDIHRADLLDGEDDGKWRGHDIAPMEATPAYPPWSTRVMETIMTREKFGDDDTTDFFYINYKSPDFAHHLWNMVSPEVGDVMRGTDDAIRQLVDWLDEKIGPEKYVLLITADHGLTPNNIGGWPIRRSQIVADVNGRFDGIDNDRSIVQGTSAVTLFMNKAEMKANDVSPEDVASFMSHYTIGDNVAPGEDIPDEYEDRREEPVYQAVFPGRALPKVVKCTDAFDR